MFPSVSRRGKLIIASKRTSVTEAFDDENDTKYTATGRKKMVSDETMSLAVEAARTVDPNAKRDYDDDFIYGDDGHGGSTWVILLDGDGKAYSTWGRNAVLTSKVEKAVNDAADAYWADFDKRWEENNKHLTAKKMKDKNEPMNLKEGWETFYFSNYDDEDVVIVVLTDKRFSPIDNKKQRESLRKNNVKILAHYLNGVVVEGKVGDIKNVCEDCHIMNPSKILKEEKSAMNETYYAVIEVDGKERRFPFNNRDTARDYIAKAQRGELPEFKGRKIGSTYTEALNVVREEVKPNIESKDGSVNESLDFTNAADVRHRLNSYSGQYLTVTFRGSYDWKYISDLLEEYNDGDEEEADLADLALDKLEAIYGSEYKLLKALKVDEIRWFTAMNRDIIVTIKVDKDDLYRNYADLINNPSIKKDTVKILELELNESLKKRYKKFPLKESTSKEKL